jgi:hypothetical protein
VVVCKRASADWRIGSRSSAAALAIVEEALFTTSDGYPVLAALRITARAGARQNGEPP